MLCKLLVQQMSLVQLTSQVKLLLVIMLVLIYQLMVKVPVHKENWLTIIPMVGRWKSKMNNDLDGIDCLEAST